MNTDVSTQLLGRGADLCPFVTPLCVQPGKCLNIITFVHIDVEYGFPYRHTLLSSKSLSPVMRQNHKLNIAFMNLHQISIDSSVYTSVAACAAGPPSNSFPSPPQLGAAGDH